MTFNEALAEKERFKAKTGGYFKNISGKSFELYITPLDKIGWDKFIQAVYNSDNNVVEEAATIYSQTQLFQLKWINRRPNDGHLFFADYVIDDL